MNQENIWGNIRQFRKNLKPNRSSLSYHTSNPKAHLRSSSQNLTASLDSTSHFNESNKENLWNMINRNHEQASDRYSKEDEVSFMPLSTEKENKMLYQDQPKTDRKSPENFFHEIQKSGSLNARRGSKTYRSEMKRIESSFIEPNDGMVDQDSSEEVDLTENEREDQKLVQDLLEQKKRMEEDLKGTKQLVLKIRKVIVSEFQRTQADLEKQQQDLHQYYQNIITNMKLKHEKELKEKEEEIEALSSFISTHDDSHMAAKEKHKTIEEYEEIIQAMKRDFEEEITRMANYYQKKSQQGLQEKEKLRLEIKDLKAQVQQLQQPPSYLPSTRREHGGDSSRLEMETTNRMHTQGNGVPPIPLYRKAQVPEKSIQGLLEKINKYMDENVIENEVSITNRRELYKEIYNSGQNESVRSLGMKPLKIEQGIQDRGTRRDGSRSFVKSKENIDEFDSDYFKSIIEECEQNHGNSELVTEDEEDTPMMNYSIKNLSKQLRFKPKCEFEN